MPRAPLFVSLMAAAVLALSACNAPAASIAAAPEAPVAVLASPNMLPPEAIHILPEAAGWDPVKLADFTGYMKAQNTTGLIIVQDGWILAEHYWPAGGALFEANFVHGISADGALIEDVASQQKSIIALLAGIAVDKGLLDLDRPVRDYLGAGWSHAAEDEEAAITARHLLEMNSGLGEDLTFTAPAGSVFLYNTPAYAKLQGVLEAAAGLPLAAITQDWLAAPLGLKDTGWRPRPESFGAVGNPVAFVTTPRDLAKIGQMLLESGIGPDGRRLISTARLMDIFDRTKTNPAYGQLWWLNGGDWSVGAGGARTEGRLLAAAPDDMVAALGALNRQLFIVPSRHLIIVRTGAAANDPDFTRQVWERLAPAMPG